MSEMEFFRLVFLQVAVLMAAMNTKGEIAFNVIIYGTFPSELSESGIDGRDILGFYEPDNQDTFGSFIQVYPKYGHYQLVPDERDGWFVSSESETTPPIFYINNTKGEFLPTGRTMIVKINGTDIPAADVIIKPCSNVNFTHFVGATYAFVPLKETFAQAQEICRALDGSLTAPDSPQTLNYIASLIPPSASSVWTGFERQETSERWMWKNYDFSRSLFEMQNNLDMVENLEGVGCVKWSVDEKHYLVRNCNRSDYFICQTNQYYFIKSRWVRFYNVQRSHNSSSQFCRSVLPNTRLFSLISASSDIKHLFEHKGNFWTHYQRRANSESITYTDVTPAVTDNSTACVILTSSEQLNFVNCNKAVVGIACQYPPYMNVNTKQAFQYGDSWIWVSDQKEDFYTANKICYENGHELLVIENESLLGSLFETLYKIKSTPKLWIKLGNTVSIRNEFFNFNNGKGMPPEESDEQCYVLNLNIFPNVVKTNCTEKAPFACKSGRSPYGLTKPLAPKFCPPGFQNIGNVTCFSHNETEVGSWPYSYKTCELFSGRSLYRSTNAIQSQQSSYLPMLYLYMTMKNITEAWTSWCALSGKQSFTGLSELVQGDCVSVLRNASDVRCKPHDWRHTLPSICTAIPSSEARQGSQFSCTSSGMSFSVLPKTALSWCRTDSLPNIIQRLSPFNHTADDNDSLGTNYTWAASQAQKFDSMSCIFQSPRSTSQPSCFFLTNNPTEWNHGCSEASLLVYETSEINNILANFLEVYRWFLSERAWIGLSSINSAARWVNGEAVQGFDAWPNDTSISLSDYCVSVDYEGNWRKDDCSSFLPSFCSFFWPVTNESKHHEDTSTVESSIDANKEETFYFTTKANVIPSTVAFTTEVATTRRDRYDIDYDAGGNEDDSGNDDNGNGEDVITSTSKPESKAVTRFGFAYNPLNRTHIGSKLISETNILRLKIPSSPECHRYKTVVEKVSFIEGSLESIDCDTSFDNITEVYCNEHTRKHRLPIESRLSLPVAGCSYRISTYQYDLLDTNLVVSKNTKNYVRPIPVSEASNVTASGISDKEIKLSWSLPDPAQMIDRYMISLSHPQSTLSFRSFVVSYTNEVVLNNLEPASRYNITVIPMRREVSTQGVSVRSWTFSEGSSQPYVWSKWILQSQCSPTCASSQKTIVRHCVGPDGAVGNGCSSKNEIKIAMCDRDPCPTHGGWSKWTQFTKCTATCGSHGRKRRVRYCTNPPPSDGGLPCGWRSEDVFSCPNIPCPLEGVWSTWSSFHQCSSSCGNGSLLWTRSCESNSSQNVSPSCKGNATTIFPCNNGPCPVDGGWSDWGSWTPDDSIPIVCGTRNATRIRTCSSPSPSNGGLFCPLFNQSLRLESQSETRLDIGKAPCPRTFWGPWSDYEPCSATCGKNAVHSRQRRCEWSDREFKDTFVCPEIERETIYCGKLNCPINGEWGAWKNWSACSVNCGSGTQYRYRLCDDPKPSYHGLPCVGSVTGSQSEERSCMGPNCPSKRYRSSELGIPHCLPDKSDESKLSWEQEFSGSIQNQSCPPGSVGTAYRKCSQNRIWLSEDLSDCMVVNLKEIFAFINSSKPGSKAFERAMKSLVGMLTSDLNGNKLLASGDLLAIESLMSLLLKWEPFQFSNVSRSNRLDYIGLVAATLEHVLQPKYEKLWKGMNTTTFLRTLQTYMNVLDKAGLSAANDLDPFSYAQYQSSPNEDLAINIEARAGWNEKLSFPKPGSPQASMDQTYIEIPEDAISVPDNTTVRIIFTKFGDSSGILSSLPITSLLKKQEMSFEGRTLNSALIGAQLMIDDKPQPEHHLKSHVYVTFYHKRKAEKPLCVFIDLQSKDGIFNDDGCQVWRKRKDKTICRCSHLTTFALLSHDVVSIELYLIQSNFNFKSMVSYVSYFCMGTLALILLLMFYPQSSLIRIDTGSFSIVLAILLRHVILQVILWLNTSNMICFISASAWSYACVLCCMWHALRIVDVYMQVAAVNDTTKRSCGFLGYGLSLLAPVSIVLVYFLYDHKASGQRFSLQCDQIFSSSTLLPAWIICGYMALFSCVLLGVTIKKFVEMKKLKKPIESYRNEKQMFLKGFGFVFGSAAVTLTNAIVLELTALPPFEMQICFIVGSVAEVVYLLFSEVWMNLELRSFYYKMIRSKPPLESVVYEPPKYIP